MKEIEYVELGAAIVEVYKELKLVHMPSQVSIKSLQHLLPTRANPSTELLACLDS